jgi:hypothetical protein
MYNGWERKRGSEAVHGPIFLFLRLNLTISYYKVGEARLVRVGTASKDIHEIAQRLPQILHEEVKYPKHLVESIMQVINGYEGEYESTQIINYTLHENQE